MFHLCKIRPGKIKHAAFLCLSLLAGQIHANEKTVRIAVATLPSICETLSGPLPYAMTRILDAAGIRYQMDWFPFSQSLHQVAMANYDMQVPIVGSPFADKKIEIRAVKYRTWAAAFCLISIALSR